MWSVWCRVCRLHQPAFTPTYWRTPLFSNRQALKERPRSENHRRPYQQLFRFKEVQRKTGLSDLWNVIHKEEKAMLEHTIRLHTCKRALLNTETERNESEWGGMDRNGPEWTGMDRNEPEWHRNGPEWTGMNRNDTGMDRNEPEWTGMDRNGPEWKEMTPEWTGMNRNDTGMNRNKFFCKKSLLLVNVLICVPKLKVFKSIFSYACFIIICCWSGGLIRFATIFISQSPIPPPHPCGRITWYANPTSVQHVGGSSGRRWRKGGESWQRWWASRRKRLVSYKRVSVIITRVNSRPIQC